MKKISKGLALILGTVITGSLMASMNVNAAWRPAIEVFTAPDGYIEDTVMSDGIMFKADNGGFSLYILNGFKYNRVEIWLTEGAEWETIYEEYWADLEFDYVNNSGLNVIMFDRKEAAGDPRTPTDIEDKSKAVSDTCKAMYKNGLLQEAEYVQMLANLSYGWHEKKFEVVNYNGTEDELKHIVSEHCDGALVNVYNTEDVPEYYIDFSDTDATYDEFVEAGNAIEAAFPNSYTNMTFTIQDNSTTVSIEPINLLTTIKEEISCDTDANGTVEITDATAILESYANTAAGIATASEEDPMDVNGDGAVSIDDATFVLTVYAELAAGLR